MSYLPSEGPTITITVTEGPPPTPDYTWVLALAGIVGAAGIAYYAAKRKGVK
jgi:MYXO-CTERM domain-containing protein